VKYAHPIEDIAAVNVPVVNIGTYGKDGHKLTERVHMQHTFELVPNITLSTIRRLLG
jgi:arginine utilization protein RocB